MRQNLRALESESGIGIQNPLFLPWLFLTNQPIPDFVRNPILWRIRAAGLGHHFGCGAELPRLLLCQVDVRRALLKPGSLRNNRDLLQIVIVEPTQRVAALAQMKRRDG